jgi:hypothetical protein
LSGGPLSGLLGLLDSALLLAFGLDFFSTTCSFGTLLLPLGFLGSALLLAFGLGRFSTGAGGISGALLGVGIHRVESHRQRR